jgi:hypothetical protein
MRHGTWYVRYRQRVLQEDGSGELKHISKHLGRSNDFSNIFAVERCRESFMQSVNQDRLSTNSRITLTAFVEGLIHRALGIAVGRPPVRTVL